MSRTRRWRLAAPSDEAVRLAGELQVSPLVARLLINRQITDPQRAGAFLAPRLSDQLRSPMLFRNMAKAADRLVQAIAQGESVGIYGDYDVDGVSGSALLLRFFRALGVPALL